MRFNFKFYCKSTQFSTKSTYKMRKTLKKYIYLAIIPHTIKRHYQLKSYKSNEFTLKGQRSVFVFNFILNIIRV